MRSIAAHFNLFILLQLDSLIQMY